MGRREGNGIQQKIEQLEKMLRHEDKKDRKSKIKKELAYYYIKFGEFLKLDTKPDPVLAKHYLEKALRYDPDNPVAHYRLAHLYYNEGNYHYAAYHFNKALYVGSGLNNTQKVISQMLLVNCGIEIASEALKEYEENEQKYLFDYDEKLIERVQNALYLTRLKDLKRGLYRIISPESDSIVTEETYFTQQDQSSSHEVILILEKDRYAGNDQMTIYYRRQEVVLDYKEFYLLAFLLHSEHPLTNDEIQETFLEKFLKVESNPDTIRKWFQRLREKIPFWNDIIEETTIERKAGRKRKDWISYRIFCRASDTFPWEDLDNF